MKGENEGSRREIEGARVQEEIKKFKGGSKRCR